MSMEYENLTPAQQELVDELPANPGELAKELGIARSSVNSRVDRIREAGFSIEYSRSEERYHLPGQSPDDHLDENGHVETPEGLVPALRKDGVTMNEMEDEYDLPRRSARRLFQQMREEGYNIEDKTVGPKGKKLWYIPNERDQTYHFGHDGVKQTFALISDTHLGSKAEHLDELHDFYDRLVDRGIDTVFHAGDITDGWKIHKGQLNEVKGEAAGWERMMDYCVENYPRRRGVDTYFIEGNHDRKFHRRNGLHLGELIDRRRADLHYIGDSQATVVFDEDSGIDLELIHPSGGKPYTEGYRLQTLYRERPSVDRPTIAGVGHLHGKLYASTEGVEGFYTGCWKGLTTYGKRKGHDSEIGGWIVEIEIENGELRRIVPEWIGYESRDTDPAISSDDIDSMRSR